MFSQKPVNIRVKINLILIVANTLNNQLQQVEGAQQAVKEIFYFYYLMNDGKPR